MLENILNSDAALKSRVHIESVLFGWVKGDLWTIGFLPCQHHIYFLILYVFVLFVFFALVHVLLNQFVTAYYFLIKDNIK